MCHVVFTTIQRFGITCYMVLEVRKIKKNKKLYHSSMSINHVRLLVELYCKYINSDSHEWP